MRGSVSIHASEDVLAKETMSEGLVTTANNFYRKNRIAIIKKNEPMKRMVNGRMIFTASMGLDFVGFTRGGQYTSFEVKETEKEFLLPGNIRDSQIDTMRSEGEMGVDPFLVVLFKSISEWYRIGHRNLIYIIEKDISKIPIEYFKAFGKIIPTDNGWPDYLNPDLHPLSNTLKKSVNDWIPAKRKKRKIKPIDKSGMSRRERILDAMTRGIKNAEKKQIRY